jgi:phosphoglycerate dehydrogenase-like enzyme
VGKGNIVTTPRLLFLTDRGERHQRTALKDAPANVKVIMQRRPSESDLAAVLPTVDFILSERNQPVTEKMIAAAPNLKLIVRLGSLSDDIAVEAAHKANVRVSVQPIVMTIYCAEHALMMILAVLKRLGRSFHAATTADHGQESHRTDENTFAFNWLHYTDISGLYGKTVAIIGMGEIGVELARRLRGFRPKAVPYNKRKPYLPQVERELGIHFASLDECMSQGDIIVTLLPYSEKTDRIINEAKFALVKPTAILVQVGSGSVIDEQALVRALRSGKLAGAALDTYEYEPLQPTHSLIELARDPNSNLLLTPHTAAASLPDDRSEDFGEIVRFLAGEPLQHEVRS